MLTQRAQLIIVQFEAAPRALELGRIEERKQVGWHDFAHALSERGRLLLNRRHKPMGKPALHKPLFVLVVDLGRVVKIEGSQLRLAMGCRLSDARSWSRSADLPLK